MAKSISDTSIKIGVDASAAPVEIEKLTKALDSISTTPLERLRDKSEEAAGRVNSAFAKTVQGVEDLKSQLASTGSLNTRLFKGLEADLGKLANLGIDEAALQKISNVLSEVRQASKSPITIRLEEERARAAASPVVEARAAAAASPAGRVFTEDPTSAASIEAARSRQFSPEEVERLKALDAELKASRELDAQKQRAIADQRAKETAAEKARRDDLSEQLKAARELDAQKKKSIDEQIDKERAAADKRRKLLGDVTGKALNAIGINVPEKAAGSLGVIGAVVTGVLAFGEAVAQAKAAQRQNGISGSTVGNFVDGVRTTVPLLGRATEIAGEFGSAIGADSLISKIGGSLGSNYLANKTKDLEFSTSTLKASQDRLNESAAIYERLRTEARDLAISEARTLRENATTLGAINRQAAGLTLGGVARQRFDLTNATQDAIAAAGNKRDDTRTNTRVAIAGISTQFATDTANIRATISGRAGSKEAEEAQALLTTLTKQKSANIKAQNEIADNADKAAAKQIAALKRLAAAQDEIVAGYRENTPAVIGAIENLAKATRTADGDPFTAMRKSLLELKPTTESLSLFNDQLERYKARAAEVERESARFTIEKGIAETLRGRSTAALDPITGTLIDNVENKGVTYEKARALQQRQQSDFAASTLRSIFVDRSTIGKNDIDAEIARLQAEGLTDKDTIRVRLELERNAALKLQADIDATVRDAKGEVKINLARTPIERINAEIAADDAKRLAPGGSGVARTDAQRAADASAGLDKYYSEQAKATIDATKTPQAKLAEAVDSLREQYKRGYLSDEEAKRGLGAGLKDYADAIRTTRPELMQAGSAQTDQYLAIASGAVIDASKPELELAREANRYLETIAKAVGGAAPVSLGIVP